MQKHYDKVPTQGSTNPVKSDGLHQQLATIGSKIDDLRDELLGGVVHRYDYTSSYFTENVLYPYVAVGSTVASITTTSGSGSYVIPINYGDTLNILARNSSGANNYPFFIVDENYTALYVGQNGTATPVERVVNVTYENAAYVIVNNAKTTQYPNSWSYVTVTSPEGGRVIDLEGDVARNTTNIGDNAAEIERIKGIIEIPSSSTYLFDACVNGSYINCATIGNAYTIYSDVLNGYLILPCSEGDTFKISTYGGNSSRAYAFADANNIVLSRTASFYTANEETVTAPEGASQLIVNLRWETATRTEKQAYFKVVAYSSEYINTKIFELEERVAELEENNIYNHEEVTETFTVKVNGNKPFSPTQLTDAIPTSSYVGESLYDHTCYFKAPSGDSPCKLVISCPGGGITASSWYSYMNHGAILNSLGYAVLCITGYSDAYYNDKGVTSNHAPIGSWMATEEAKKAYKYLIEKYKWIDRNGVFLYGESQGGMVAENIAEESGIPICATVLDAPAISMQYAQMYIPTRAACINVLYGLSNHNFNKAACVGCDPFTRNMSEDIVMDESGTLPVIGDINSVTAKKYRSCGSPIMILSGSNDTTISPDVHKCYAKALMNANAPIQFLLYDGVGHGVIQYSSVIGTVSSISCTSGLAKVLEFYNRFGGYGYTIVTSS